MDFPIVDLIDDGLSPTWLMKHFHPNGLCCPRYTSEYNNAYIFRQTQRSALNVYRCHHCSHPYTLYTGTVFAGRHLRPSQVVLLLLGILQGQSSAQLARELSLSCTTVHKIRKQLHQQVKERNPQTPLPDSWSETDEMFQNEGKKGQQHLDEDDPPRRRANKQRGHGTYDNDRPLIVDTIGRTSAQVRSRVVHHTDSATL